MMIARATVFSLAACAAPVGCSLLEDPNVPEPIRALHEPEAGGEYLLYCPSTYDRAYRWPLFVVCHSRRGDSPVKQVRAWNQLAEDRGFLVLAPRLGGAGRSRRKYAAQLRDDEERILRAVRHVRAGYSVSTDRVFIFGWSGGAPAALYTGLRHPDVFRAIAITQPKFVTDSLTGVEPWIDPHQPVFVKYRPTDLVSGRDAKRCVEWLRSKVAGLTEDAIGAAGHGDTSYAIQFFQDVLRTQPLIRIRAFPTGGANPLEYRFKLRCSFEVVRYQWVLPEGTNSPVAQPVHTFAKPGTYQLRVAVEGADGERYERSATLTVPGGTPRPWIGAP